MKWPDSRRRGRSPEPGASDGRGLAPPLSPWVPPLFWLTGSVVLVVVVLAVVPGPGPLDDPDPAYQRPGFVLARGDATRVSNLSLPGSPRGRHPVVIVFDRGLPDAGAFHRLQRGLPPAFAIVLVISDGQRPTQYPFPVFVDRQGRTAAAVGMRTPKDGGQPVGYAIVDRQARVRYTTLDPGYLQHGNEAATMAGAIG